MRNNQTDLNKKIRIIDFSPYYSPHVGGLERYAEELHDNLTKNNCQITVFTPHIPEDASVREERNSITIIRYPAFEIIFNFPIPCFWKKEFWRQWKEIKNKEFDLVVSTLRFFVQPSMALFYAKRKKLPLLHIEHGSDFVKSTFPISLFARIFDYTLGRLVMVKANCIITPSLSAKHFVRILSGKKSTVIYRGMPFAEIDAAMPRNDLREKYKNKKIIAYIGRLIFGKGLIHLLEAVKSLNRDDIVVFIVGDGGEMKNLKTYVEDNGLSEQVVFFGNLPFIEGIGIMKIIDIFAHPSYNEGLPTSVLEAGACERAIVATNAGGTVEILTHGRSGIIIEPYSTTAILNALRDLLDNPEKCREFGENARKEIMEKFNWDICTAAYLKEIDSILKKDSGNMKKKVLHVITGLEVGGAETNLSRLLPKLEDAFENRVCCLTGRGVMGKKLSESNIPVYYLDIKNVFGFLNPLIIWRFRKIIKEFQPDIIETYLIHADLFGRIWGRIFGVKKIICSHRGSLLQWEWLSFIDKTTSFLVTKYVFQTPSAQKEISKKLKIDIEKTVVIPNVMDMKIFDFEIDRNKKISELGVKEGNLNIVSVSNLRKGKGQKYLIKAFDRVFSRGRKDINLVLVGDGDQREKLENQADSLESKKNIFFLGKRSDVPEILKSSDIFVLPTFYEGMSNAIMEAMAVGLAIITTDIDVNKDLLEDGRTGFLVPVRNSQEIEKNLIKLLGSDELRKGLGANAFNEMKENYSIEKVAEKVKTLLSSINYE